MTWPPIVNVLIERYLNNLIPGNPYNTVATAWHRSQKTEQEFATQLEAYAGVCSNIFSKHLPVSHFLRGLQPTTAVVVAEQLHQVPPRDRVNFSMLRRLAQAEVTTYRAQTNAHSSLLRDTHTTTNASRRSSISTIVGAEKRANSKHNVLAVAKTVKPVMLKPGAQCLRFSRPRRLKKTSRTCRTKPKTMDSTRSQPLHSAFPKRCRSVLHHFSRISWTRRCRSSRLTDPNFIADFVMNRLTRCTSAPISHWRSRETDPIRDKSTIQRP